MATKYVNGDGADTGTAGPFLSIEYALENGGMAWGDTQTLWDYEIQMAWADVVNAQLTCPVISYVAHMKNDNPTDWYEGDYDVINNPSGTAGPFYSCLYSQGAARANVHPHNSAYIAAKIKKVFDMMPVPRRGGGGGGFRLGF